MWRKAELNHMVVQEQSEMEAGHSGARGDWENMGEHCQTEVSVLS